MPLKKRLVLVLLISLYDRSRSFKTREIVRSRLKTTFVDVSELKNGLNLLIEYDVILFDGGGMG